MIYSVRHTTQFRYSQPVTESVMEVRMQPRRDERQHCLSFELATEPITRVTVSRDYLGNIVHHFGVLRPHRELTIRARAIVSMAPALLPEPLGPESWSEIDALGEEGEVVEMLLPSHFARQTPLLRDFARELDVVRQRDPLTTLLGISHRLYGAMRYLPQSTNVDSPIDVALRHRQGVCQDYAHIMIALVRGLGIPCRYVSGYLYERRSDTSRVLPDATHAWVEAFLPGRGWIGFDPTNDMLAGERHIRVAVGRDYADVPPTRGVFKGEADTSLGVAVEVYPAEEEPQDEELWLVMKPFSRPSSDGEQPEQQQQRCLIAPVYLDLEAHESKY